MFYTKYRPQKFSEIEKPNDVAKALANQVKNDKVGHAYLFIGARGTGKTTTARILAKALNCENIDKDGNPCDECDACVAIKTGNYLDLIEIDAASNRGIDDIRDLRDKIKLAPASGKKKVYIIDEVHMLTKEAFNALLKTLEEPPSHAVFVLCTTEEHKVPDTIKSRCQVFHFKRATIEQLVNKLELIIKEEKVKSKFKKEDLEKIAKASFGGFRDAETILQQVVEGELDVDSFVGTSSKQGFIDFMDSLLARDVTSAIRQINSLYEDGVDLNTWTIELLKYMRDLLFISTDSHEGLIDVPEDTFVLMEDQASKIMPARMAFILDTFVEAEGDISSSAISQLPLEIAVVKVCEGVRFTSPQDVSGGNPSADISGGGSENKKHSHTSNPKTKKSGGKSKSNLKTSVNQVTSAWEDVLKGTTKYNHGVRALLKAAEPVEISDNQLVVEVFYKFHKERLETPKNKKIVEKVLTEIFSEEFTLTCVLSDKKPEKKGKKESGELTDKNIEKPKDVSMHDALVDVFDGTLPL